MCYFPHIGFLIFNHFINGEVTDNPTDWLGSININFINIYMLEYPLAVLIFLLAIKDKLAEVGSDG
jgi:hypothetical protein